jgi:polar amino acid transport system substrate-binding protein
MMRNTTHTRAGSFYFLGLCCLTFVGPAHGETVGTPQTANPVQTGTKDSPPFAIKGADGTWSGISVDLWREIARDLGWRFEFHEYELAPLIEQVASGAVDAAVAALTVTTERETRFDFSHPFYTSGLGIAVSAEPARAELLLESLVSSDFLKAVAALALLLFMVGALVWLFERRRNWQQFGDGLARGLGSAFWWSAVTMTTVGYGDKVPLTVSGRVVALVWMFASILLISTFTGAIASALTVDQLAAAVHDPKDLVKVRVGTVRDSTSEAHLREQHIRYRAFDEASQGLEAILDHEIDAMVYDAPLLRYSVNNDYPHELLVLPQTFRRQDYAIAFPPGSGLREKVNRVLLRKIQSPAWQDTLYRYLGQR